MKNLTKVQKFLILASIFWEVIAYRINYHRHELNFEDFMIASSPVIIYWSVVWIWGFGAITKLFQNIKNSSKVRTCIKYLIYIISLILLICILKPIKLYIHNTLHEIINDEIMEFVASCIIIIVITAILLFVFSKPAEENKVVEENTKENDKDKSDKVVNTFSKTPILVVLLLSVLVLIGESYSNNKISEEVLGKIIGGAIGAGLIVALFSRSTKKDTKVLNKVKDNNEKQK